MLTQRRRNANASLVRTLGAFGFAVALAFASAAAHAQATVESRVSIVRGEAVQITNIDDWVIGVFGPTDDISTIAYRWDATCVYSSSGVFRLEVSLANGGAGPMRLRNGDTPPAEMAYEIYTYSRSATTNGFELVRFTSGPVVQTNRVGSTALDCNGGSNMWFAALVRPGPFNAAPSGLYRDYATILVTPE